MFTPDDPHRRAATAQSARVRRARVQLKADLGQYGLRHLANVLQRPPEHARKMPVYGLLVACRRVGPANAAQILREADRMTIHRRVEDLTERQRRLLIRLALKRAER